MTQLSESRNARQRILINTHVLFLWSSWKRVSQVWFWHVALQWNVHLKIAASA